MRKISEVLYELIPVVVLVIGQCISAGMTILYKLAVNTHFSVSVLVAYRFLFASVAIIPVALYVERNKRPKMTWMILFQSFINASFGATISQNMGIKSLQLTSATYSTAILNLTPAVTFILSIIFGVEKLQWRKGGGIPKVIGTICGIGGATVLTLYKGIKINLWKSPINLLTLVDQREHVQIIHQNSTNMVLGSILALGCVFTFAASLIIQSKMMAKYPCPYTCTALTMVMGCLQSTIYALCIERDWSQWRLGWNIRLLTVAYAGILGSGLVFSVTAWCIQIRGPLFVSIFNPLMLVIVAIAGSILIGEQLYMGSVIGAILIICGLYLVIWGKGKDLKRTTQVVPEEDISLPARDSTKSQCVQIDITSSAAINSPVNGRKSNDVSSAVDEDVRVHAKSNINSEEN